MSRISWSLRGVLATRAGRVVLWLAILAQVALVAGASALEVRLLGTVHGSPGGGASVVVMAVTILAVPLVGGVLLARRPTQPIGWLFAAANLGWAMNSASSAYVRYAEVAGLSAGTEALTWLYTWPAFLSTALLVLLILLFPDGRLPSFRWRWLVRAIVPVAVLGAVGAAFGSGPVDDSIGLSVHNPFGMSGLLGTVLWEVGSAALPVLMVLFVPAAAAMAMRFRRSTGVERQQLKWFVSAVAVFVVLAVALVTLVLIHGSFEALPPWAEAVGLAAIASEVLVAAAAGVAILRYRLYDIDRIVSRTVSYAVVTVVLVGLYATGVIGFGAVVRTVAGDVGSDLVVAASTLLVAAAFGPVRRRVQALVDRRFNRTRYDAQRTVEAFARQLRDEVDIDALSDGLRSVVHDAVQPREISVWVPASPVAGADR